MQQPWGFSPLDPTVRVGNQLLCVALVVLWACSRLNSTSASHGHPLSAYSWKVPQWEFVRKAAGYHFVCLDMCAFGTLSRQSTGLATVNAPALADLERPCPGGHTHVLLDGKTTGRATKYPQEFADAFVAALVKQWANRTQACAADATTCASGAQQPRDPHWESGDGACCENLAVNHFIRASDWTTVLSARVKHTHHINVLETQALLRMQRSEARLMPGTRQVALVDSRVTIGANAKGRSAAAALNAPMLEALPDFLVCDYYPGLGFVGTRLNPADAPSRIIGQGPINVPISVQEDSIKSAAAVGERSCCFQRGFDGTSQEIMPHQKTTPPPSNPSSRLYLPASSRVAASDLAEDMLRLAGTARQSRRVSDWALFICKL